MTKSDLVSGKHVVELRNGRKGLRIGWGLIESDGLGFMHMSNIEEDLTHSMNKNKDIVAVYEIGNYGYAAADLESYINSAHNVWRRNDNQKEYDKLMKQIDELKAQAEKLKL